MIKELLNQKIKDASLEDLKQKLDYQSIKKLEKSFNKFLKTKTIYEWLNSEFYDLL
jgi:IS30 family transposase